MYEYVEIVHEETSNVFDLYETYVCHWLNRYISMQVLFINDDSNKETISYVLIVHRWRYYL
jgi:hypothetical protein